MLCVVLVLCLLFLVMCELMCEFVVLVCVYGVLLYIYLVENDNDVVFFCEKFGFIFV